MKKFNEGINLCLSVIGEQVLAGDISIEGIYEAELADLLIEATKKEILEEGWTFNTDTNWELAPDVDGYIVISENILRIDPSSTSIKAIRKDGKLYNKATQSYVFDNSVDCDIVWELDFDDLPPIMQQYIILKASRILYQRLVGDGDMLSILVKDEQEALLRVKTHEDDIGDYNIFDNQTVSRIISRNANPQSIG